MQIFPKPRWAVTWPTRPYGVYTTVVRAYDPTDAVRTALQQRDLPVYALAFDYEPEVWRLLHPYSRRSYRAAGPDYGGVDGTEEAFTPIPLDLRQVADQVVKAVQSADAHGGSAHEVRAVVHQIVGTLLPSLTERVLGMVAADSWAGDAA